MMNITGDDQYDHFMSTQTFTLTMNKINHMNSHNGDTNGYTADSGWLTISH